MQYSDNPPWHQWRKRIYSNKRKKSSKPVQQRTVGGQRPKTADDIQGPSRGTFQG